VVKPLKKRMTRNREELTPIQGILILRYKAFEITLRKKRGKEI